MTEVVTIENSEEQTKSKGFSAGLGHRDYARLWSGQLVSNISTAISIFKLHFQIPEKKVESEEEMENAISIEVPT